MTSVVAITLELRYNLPIYDTVILRQIYYVNIVLFVTSK